VGPSELALLSTGERLASRRRQGVHADVGCGGWGLAGSNSPDPLEYRCARAGSAPRCQQGGITVMIEIVDPSVPTIESTMNESVPRCAAE